MSGTSAECTQRTGRSSRSAPATTRGDPYRTESSASTSRTVRQTPRHRRHSSQNATAAAAATLSESTPRRIGIATRTSLAASAPADRPGALSAEQQRRPLAGPRHQDFAGVRQSAAGVIAITVNPAARTVSSACGHGSSLAYGIANTSPMLTRTLRR